jgi:hypothetical protein
VTLNELIQLWEVLKTDLGSFDVPPVLVLKVPIVSELSVSTSSKSNMSGHLPSETFLINFAIGKFFELASVKLHDFTCKLE